MADKGFRVKFALSLALLAAAVVGYAALRLPALFAPREEVRHVVVSGNIEAHQSVLSVTQVQAAIVYLPFDEGTYVKRGTVLARVDDGLYQRQTEIDRANLDVQMAQVRANASSLTAAENSVASDQFDHAEKKVDYGRADVLAQHDAVSQQTRDLARTAERQSAATLAHDLVYLVALAREPSA